VAKEVEAAKPEEAKVKANHLCNLLDKEEKSEARVEKSSQPDDVSEDMKEASDVVKKKDEAESVETKVDHVHEEKKRDIIPEPANESPREEEKAKEDQDAVEAALAEDFGALPPPLPVTSEEKNEIAEKKEADSSVPKLDLKMLTMTRDLRYFRDILCFELGPNPKFLRPGHEPTMAQFERIVKTVVDNYEAPAKDKPSFIAARGKTQPPLSNADKALLEEHGISKTCNLQIKDVSSRDKYKGTFKTAYDGFFRGKKAMVRRRKERLLKGLKMLKDDSSGHQKIVDHHKKKRPFLDSDNLDDGVKNYHKHKKHKKVKDNRKERSGSTEKKSSFM